MAKKLKRIEINEKAGPGRVRVSRTGGVSASVSPLKGFTLNTKHGARVSKTFKGLTLGLQNLNSVVRGRWSTKKEGLNVNLSKSGLSVSAKNSLGTFNFKNPNRSSATFAGIQIRGKNAAWIAGLGFILDVNIKKVTIGYQSGIILDVSKKHWKSNGKIDKTTPETSFTGAYSKVRVGFNF